MILYFVRHGQTDFNITHRLQGVAFDEPLNAHGRDEMEELCRGLPDDFEVIYTAPLKRTRESAEIIHAHFQIPIETCAELNERSFGSLAGKLWSEIPDGEVLHQKDRTQQYDYHAYGGESVEDVRARIQKFLESASRSGHTCALVVSSIGIIRLAHLLIRGENVIDVPNASFYRFDI